MKKKNGFTLIELLAIIVILAIIAVITVPIILNIIENSRKGAATDSAYGFKDAVNKYYVQELANNNSLKLQGTYDVSNGALNGDGINNVAIPVSGDKPSSGKLHYTNNVLDDGCLVIGDYKVTFKSDGSVNETVKGNCDDYVIGGSGQNSSALAIGTDIDYTTSINGVTLDNWKVFLSDSEYTYLIYGDYLPREAISSDTKTTYNLADGDGPNNTIKSTTNRADLINAMTTKSNWDSLLIGTINGHAVAEVRTANVWAIGAPDINLWANSWNSEINGFTTTMILSGDDTNGYSINENSSITIQSVDQSKTNYSLYVPHTSTIYACAGYRLASPSVTGAYYTMVVQFNGSINSSTNNNGGFAFRPVIKLPTSVVNQ